MPNVLWWYKEDKGDIMQLYCVKFLGMITRGSSVGRAVDCSMLWYESIGHWFDSGPREYLLFWQFVRFWYTLPSLRGRWRHFVER